MQEYSNTFSEILFNKDEDNIVSSLNLLSTKPVLYIANVDEDSAISGNNFSKNIIK